MTYSYAGILPAKHGRIALVLLISIFLLLGGGIAQSQKPEPPPEEAIGTARSCIWSQNPSSIGNTGVRHALLKRAGRNGMA